MALTSKLTRNFIPDYYESIIKDVNSLSEHDVETWENVFKLAYDEEESPYLYHLKTGTNVNQLLEALDKYFTENELLYSLQEGFHGDIQSPAGQWILDQLKKNTKPFKTSIL